MNNNPDTNNNRYRASRPVNQTLPESDFHQAPRQARPVSRQPQNMNGEMPRQNPNRAVTQQNPNRQMQPNAQQQRPRRPLTDEERRRLEAARQASNRVNPDDEARRRRMDQAELNAAQASMVGDMQRRAMVNQQTAQAQRQAQQQKKRKKKVRINVGLILFVLLISGVIGVSAYQINQNSDGSVPDQPDYSLQDQNEETSGEINRDGTFGDGDETAESAETSAETTENGEEVPVNLNLYDTVTVQNTAVDEGDLILVNYQYAYADADTVALKNIYEERTVLNNAGSRKLLRVSRSDTSMTAEAFAALEAMAQDLREDTGDENLLINSGHRGTASQQSVWDSYLASHGEEYTKQYVAVPGYSEHHTGLACDLGFYTDDGATVSVADYEYGWWLAANCADNGFVLRYPDDKVAVTGIAYEKWHFRYVGVPHAYAMTANNLCLEEYIDYVRAYTADGKMLHVKSDRTLAEVDVTAAEIPADDGWLIYYVPMTEGEATEFKVPRNSVYEVSGNNVDGYIVTVALDETN